MQTLKKNLVAIIIVIITIILGGIAIFTAWRLYSIKTTAPTEPAAATTTDNNCELTFSITVSTASPTGSPTSSPTASPTGSPTSSPTASPTATPTSSPTNSPTATPTNSPTSYDCNDACTTDAQCQGDLGTNYYCNPSSDTCRLKAYPNDIDCIVATTTPTPTSTSIAQAATPAPTQAPLPDSGISTPTILGIAAGTLLLLGAIILAL